MVAPKQGLHWATRENIEKFHTKGIVRKASNAVVLLFTATPIVNSEKGTANYLRLLEMITQTDLNDKSLDTGALEGYVLRMTERPESVFVNTSLKKDEIDHGHGLPTVVSCRIKGAALKSYAEQVIFKRDAFAASAFLENVDTKVDPKEKVPGWNFKGSYNHRNDGNTYTCDDKPENAEYLHKYATKLDAVAKFVKENKEKTLVFLNKTHGMRALRHLIHIYYKVPQDEVHFFEPMNNKNHGDASTAKSVKKRQELEKTRNVIMLDRGLWKDKFNKQPDGSTGLRVLVLCTSEWEEGNSFFGVRNVIFVGLSNKVDNAVHSSNISQLLARAIRMCSHKYADSTQTKFVNIQEYINFFLYVTTIEYNDALEQFKDPKKAKQVSSFLTNDQRKYLELVESKKVTKKLEDLFKNIAIDNDLYKL